ncbi:acyl-CoA dehydrogenase C-terminal domain-containing protein [Falsiruegeria mediterranea]|uniref:3-methylmercaptopropionyl-CoA dehydrogenase n=1 Tax=Falsiruegeria mediterranea M17 TaxID=1200281 RepID=A0A2R8CG48_9RHOB|nr:acyl-CoA dehydrogenase C-terminal domain-containing protein [Falsiruegeria mediterranea]SPJ31377.1 3-methylmercaptopropionyl-CoA dehydrogenase [Falsiruegeria mediterranea M17]
MPTYTAPLRDIDFVLHEALKVSQADIPGYEDLTPDLTGPVLEEAGKIASNVLAPLNRVGDQEGTSLVDGKVQVPNGFPEAINVLREGGWTSLDLDVDYGGQGLPKLMHMAAGECFSSANHAMVMYGGLTHGAWNTIFAHGTEAQKHTYLPKMANCEWFGTMNLTEPNCGTDLGLMRTSAEPQDDGSYKITGTKIFISAGDHEMGDNIIHLVLAKIPGGPEGIKGVSLFIVPKYLVNDDDSLGERNAVRAGRLETKMGIHGNATCEMNFEGATGYLLGQPNKGMSAMFTLVNEARIGTGAQGYCIAEAAYQNAVAYARERLQMRAVTGPANPDGPADPIIVHPDIRRTLMDQRSFIEGARVFAYWCTMQADRVSRTDDAGAQGLLSLVTPVFKAFSSDKGYEAATDAQQVLGGHGYIEEWGMSQFVRDVRIAKIYEGANGVQALDLVGRKLGADGGKHTMAYGVMIKGLADRLIQNEALTDMVGKPLMAGLGDFQSAGQYMMQNGMKDPNAALAGSTDFLHLMGHLTMGYMLALSAEAAQAALEAGTGDAAFYTQKLLTVRHYFNRHLPMTRMHLKRIQAGPETVMAPDAAAF